MRKYEKIRENILMMQHLNSKKILKEEEITPGPNSYNPSYNFVEPNPLSVMHF